MAKFITVVDYGLGNLRSVSKALELAGARVSVTSNPKEILSAQGVVLPGVGAFHRGIENLKKLGIIPSLLKVIEEKKPFLGICLGLQLLFTESEEHAVTSGLGVIKGNVRKFTGQVKIPHMGWNEARQVTGSQRQCASLPKGDKVTSGGLRLFDNIPDNSFFYFVHSYFVEPEDKNAIIATTDYGQEFTSAVVKDNVWGVQFHPEKSADLGLAVLKNFICLC